MLIGVVVFMVLATVHQWWTLQEKTDTLAKLDQWIHKAVHECQQMAVPAGAPNIVMCSDGTSYRSLTLDDMAEVTRCRASVAQGKVSGCDRLPAVPVAVKLPNVAR